MPSGQNWNPQGPPPPPGTPPPPDTTTTTPPPASGGGYTPPDGLTPEQWNALSQNTRDAWAGYTPEQKAAFTQYYNDPVNLSHAGRGYSSAAEQMGYGRPPGQPSGNTYFPGSTTAPADFSGAPVIPGIDPGSAGGGVGTLEGLDFTQPGALEEYQRQMGGYFGQPTLSEMFARDSIAQGAGAAPSNRAEQAFQQFNSSSPADMSAYYDNERRKGEENIRRQMAARGSYGSSAADDLYNEMDTNLAADAAKANAQYGLQRGSLLGSLAQGADSSSLAGSNDRRNWMSALGSLAGQGDQAGLSRVVAGGNLAGAAQGAQRTRGQDAFNNQLSMGDRMSGILGNGYGGIFGSDMDLFKTGVGLNTGTAAEGYSQAAANAAQNRTDVSNFNNLLGGNFQLGRGLVDMYQQGQGSGPPPPAPMPAGYGGPPPGENYGTSNYYFPGRP
jgi:hypothetical protein